MSLRSADGELQFESSGFKITLNATNFSTSRFMLYIFFILYIKNFNFISFSLTFLAFEYKTVRESFSHQSKVQISDLLAKLLATTREQQQLAN